MRACSGAARAFLAVPRDDGAVNVTRIIDLSHPIRSGMPVFPGDPEVRLSPALTVDPDGVNVLSVQMGSQSGTHVDAPCHVDPAGARLDTLDPGLFFGPGVIADVTGRAPRTPITWPDLAPVAGSLAAGCILLVRTGWDAHWGTPAYFDHPYLTAGATREIINRGVRTIALDAASIDAHDDATLAAHHVVAAAGGVIAENLTRLGSIGFPDPWISLLPMPLSDADGAPVRAVALG